MQNLTWISWVWRFNVLAAVFVRFLFWSCLETERVNPPRNLFGGTFNDSCEKKCLTSLRRADAKSTPAYSSDLHFSGLYYRPDRGMLICSKICWKSSIRSKKVNKAICPIKVKINNFNFNFNSNKNCYLKFLQMKEKEEFLSGINFSALEKSSFLKSMILINFPVRWYLNFLNLYNISMMLNKCTIRWFSIDVTI